MVLGVCSLRCLAAPYVVKPGDNLWKLAKKMAPSRPVLGDEGTLQEILGKNPQIKNPDLIYIGQKLALSSDDAPVRGPKPASASEMGDVEAGKEQTAPEHDPEPPQNQAKPSASAEFSSPAAEPPDQFGYYSKLIVMPEMVFTRIDATDTHTGGTQSIVSNVSPALNLGWTQQWSKTFLTRLDLQNAYFPIEQIPGRSTTNHLSLTTVGLGGWKQVSERFSLGVTVGVEQAPVVTASSLNSLSLDSAETEFSNFGIQYDIFRASDLKFTLEGNAGLVFPSKFSDYSLSTGSNFSGTALIQQQLSSLSLQGGFVYQVTQYNFSVVHETQTDFGFYVGLAWRLGSDKK